MKKVSVIGLRSATPEEIERLKTLYPQGEHITHDKQGNKLPYNGVFRTNSSFPFKWKDILQP